MQNTKPSWEKLKQTLKDSYSNYIPNQLFTDDRLHASSIKIFGVINALCFSSKSECYPSQSLISYLANVSLKTVSRAVKELKECGYLNVTFRKGFSCIYTAVSKFAQNVVNTIKNKAKSAKEKKQNKQQQKESSWNYHGQREYNLETLESELLKWSTETDLDNSEYLQLAFT